LLRIEPNKTIQNLNRGAITDLLMAFFTTPSLPVAITALCAALSLD
jgi:hypothetical protein